MFDSTSPDERPVADDEVLLRRVESNPHKFNFSTGRFDLRAFVPTERDTDGPSVFRLGPDYLPTPQHLLDAAKNPSVREYGGVAGFTAAQLRSVGGEPIPTPDPDGLSGHCSIPAMSRALYKGTTEQQERVLAMAAALARFASPPLLFPKPQPPKPPR